MSSRRKQIINVLFLYIIAYIYSLVYAPMIANDKDHFINKLHEKCLYECDVCRIITSGRGDNYYIAAMTPEKQKQLNKCLFSFWGLTHFILYVFIGYFAPDLFYETFIVGIVFEVFEFYKYDCADPLDIVWNTLGFIVGKSLRTGKLVELKI